MVDKVCNILKDNNLFLTGGAGVGKSHTTLNVAKKLLSEGKNVVSLGSTGVSAVAIGGMTVHSFFVFGISSSLEELEIHDRKSKQRLSELKKIIASTDIIIIDEVSMISASLIDMIHFRLKSMGFKGKVMFVGDFFQLSPVVKYKESVSLFEELLFAFESNSWQNFDPVTVELTKMHRTKDSEFTNILSRLRRGDLDEKVAEYLFSLSQNQIPQEATYLFGRNDDVERLNRQMLESLSTPLISLYSKIVNNGDISQARVANWQKSLPVGELLTLKVGAPVLFCVNKWGKYANGERGIVKEITDEAIIVQKGSTLVSVAPYEFELNDFFIDEDNKVKSKTLATMSQFPLKLAYAITIHKSQGMSIDNLVCNINHIFAPSQFYVALSRAIDPKRLKIEFDRGDIRGYFKKIVATDARVREFYSTL